MKGKWLYIAFCFWLFHYFSLPICILLLVVLFLFYVYRFRKYSLLFLCLCIFMLFRYQTYCNDTKPISKLFQIKEVHQNYSIAQNKEAKVLLYQMPNHHIDDIVEVSGDVKRIDSIRNQGQFQFVEWANRRGYFYAITVERCHLIEHGHSLRHHLFAYIDSFSSKQREFLKSVLFSLYDDQTAFILVSCGMHISYFGYKIKQLCQKKYGRNKANIVRFIVMLCISFVSVLSLSLVRILCFCLVDLLFASMEGKDRLGISVCFLLALLPYSASEISFYIPVCLRLVNLFNVAKRKPFLLNQLILILLQLHFFHTCDLFTVLLFPILRKIYGWIYITTWLSLLPNFSFLCECCIKLYHFVTSITAKSVPIYGKVYILWFVQFLIFFIRYISYRDCKSKWWVCYLAITFFLYPYLSPFTMVTMLDVGQGDCTIITTPHKRNVYMIDIMGHKKKNIPKEIVVPYLRSLGIYRIDKLIITHHDFDHNGGLEQLCELMQVKNVIDQKESAKKYEEDWMKFLLLDYQGVDENDNSIVTYLKFYNLSYMFMGDLGVKGEEYLISKYPTLKADVLKVGHHGSNTSSSPYFIHQIHPTLSLMSCGRNNFYHHPSPSVMKTLEKEQSYPVVTKINGSLTIYESRWFSFFITGDHQFGILYSTIKHPD